MAEDCFNDLFETGILEREVLFWLPQNEKQCASDKPNEDGKLTAGENCWDYLSGLTNINGNMPLIFEASDGGSAKKWSEEGGHPWSGAMIAGYADGSSARIEKLDDQGTVKVTRKGKTVDLCVPIPAEDGWPSAAKIAAATPVN